MYIKRKHFWELSRVIDTTNVIKTLLSTIEFMIVFILTQ